MKKSDWLKNALVLGIVFFIAIWFVKPVGVSTQFSVLSGIVHSTINQDVITKDPTRESGYRSTNAYYDRHEGKLAKSIKEPLNYDFVFVLGMPIGAYIMYRLNRKKQPSRMSDVGEVSGACEAKQSFIRRYGPSFVGGFLILFGARMADGCTSGHMMSGMMQGAVSGYIFAGAVFIVAIPIAIVIGKNAKRKAADK